MNNPLALEEVEITRAGRPRLAHAIGNVEKGARPVSRDRLEFSKRVLITNLFTHWRRSSAAFYRRFRATLKAALMRGHSDPCSPADIVYGGPDPCDRYLCCKSLRPS